MWLLPIADIGNRAVFVNINLSIFIVGSNFGMVHCFLPEDFMNNIEQIMYLHLVFFLLYGGLVRWGLASAFELVEKIIELLYLGGRERSLENQLVELFLKFVILFEGALI